MKLFILSFITLISVSCSSVGKLLVEKNVHDEKMAVDAIIKSYEMFSVSKEAKENLAAIKKYDVASHFEKYFFEEVEREEHKSLIESADSYYVEAFSHEHSGINLYKNCSFSDKDISSFKKEYAIGNTRRDFVEEQVDLFVKSINKNEFLGQALWKYISYDPKYSNIFYEVRVQSMYSFRMCTAKGLSLVELNLVRKLLLSKSYTIFMKKYYEIQNIVTKRILKDIENL